VKYAYVIFLSVVCRAVQYSFTSSHKTTQVPKRKKVTAYKRSILVVCTIVSETFVVLRRTERHVIKNVFWSSWEIPDVLDVVLTVHRR